MEAEVVVCTQASFLSLNEIARGARSAPTSGRASPVPSRPASAMSGIMNENYRDVQFDWEKILEIFRLLSYDMWSDLSLTTQS